MSTLQDLLQEADSYKERINSAQTLGNNITADDHPRKDCYEAVDYGAAYDFMLDLARQPDLNITEEIILKLHALLYQKFDATQAGQYRTTLPGTSQADASKPEYVPPASEDVPRLMGHLADQIHFSRSTLHPIELAAMAHKRLVDISPFIDGNYRTACLLMNLILVHAGYGVVPIPSGWREDYLNALSESRRLNDMEPFSKLIARCVIE